jgi:hypothetical protein
MVLPGLFLLASACLPSAGSQTRSSGDEEAFATAARNGEAANEAFRRSRRLMNDWLAHADPQTGLLPHHLTEGGDYWNARDAAADLYPFLVLTASFTDPELYRGRMLEMLFTETALTSRVGRLPDTYSFATQGFREESVDMDEVVFGSSEYIKDGLLPITEWLGETPWRARMIGMLDDLWRIAPVETPYGAIVSTNPEVNGEMLQVLSRVYWMTGEPRYLEYAVRLGDYYLLGERHPTRDFEQLRLRDHGNEIVSGLTELYATLHHARPEKAAEYRPEIHAMLDRILEVGRNEDGLFYNVIDPRSGASVNDGVADNFGYILNGFYTVHLLDGTEAYREATRRALAVLDARYRGFNWENLGQDGDADAVEGALNLYNREPVPSAADWIEYQIRWMWSKQDSAHRENARQWKGSGIVEGGYADGNFNRTSLMYALWKTAGTTARPWREDLAFGAVQRDDALLVSLRAGEAWSGELRFDPPRHRTHMGMPLDWPRINQFPEWFAVEAAGRYEVRDLSAGTASVHSGAELLRGLPLELSPGREVRLVVDPIGTAR